MTAPLIHFDFVSTPLDPLNTPLIDENQGLACFNNLLEYDQNPAHRAKLIRTTEICFRAMRTNSMATWSEDRRLLRLPANGAFAIPTKLLNPRFRISSMAVFNFHAFIAEKLCESQTGISRRRITYKRHVRLAQSWLLGK